MSATNPIPFSLTRNSQGQLVLRLADGSSHVGVTPVRAYPLSDPEGGLSLVGSDGKEAVWVPALSELNGDLRQLLLEELATREFEPRIERIVEVSTFSTPSTWTVETHLGPCQFVLKAEEDIRRLGNGALLITDSQGVGFRVANRWTLDRRSRRFLERFL